MKRVSDNVRQKICDEYIHGQTNKILCEKYNLHRSSIQRILLKNNVKLRKQCITSRIHRLLNFNNGISNHNDAYIFGLIMSDGNLFRNCIDICLKETDKHILSEISHYVYGYEQLSYRPAKEFDVGDKTYTSAPQVRLLISSKDVTNKLRNIGLIENKSLILEYPKIEPKYDKEFILGFFDGDGCLCIPTIKNNVEVTIVSNHIFCEQIKNIIMKYVDINVRVNTKTDNVSCVRISGKQQVLSFCNWLYDNHTMFKMKRKYEKYLELL